MKEVFIKTLSMGIVLCILTACTGRPSPSTYSNSSATSSDSNVEADNKNTEPTATGFKNLTRPYYSVLVVAERAAIMKHVLETTGPPMSLTLTIHRKKKYIYVMHLVVLMTMKDVLLGYLRRMLAYFPSFQVIIFYLSIAPMVEKRESSHFLELMPHLWMEATVKHLLHLTMGNVLAMCFVPTENPLSAH